MLNCTQCPSRQDRVITDEQMDEIGCGCFVKVCSQHGDFWTEIRAINGNEIHGEIRGELEHTVPVSGSFSGEAVFSKDLILEAGCDQYCWC